MSRRKELPGSGNVNVVLEKLLYPSMLMFEAQLRLFEAEFMFIKL
jgi:hypothetical protein